MRWSTYLRAVRRRWPAVVGGALVGILVASAAILILPPKYETTGTVLVTPAGAQSASDLSESSSVITSRMKTYSELASSPLILDAVATRIHLDPATLDEKSVSAEAEPETSLITIRVTNRDPGRATIIANAIVDYFAEALPNLAGVKEGAPMLKVVVVSKAISPKAPASPRPELLVPVGFAIGTLFALTALYVAVQNKGKGGDE